MPSIYDLSLYNTIHENNRTVFQALKEKTIYNNNPRVSTTRQPRVKLSFVLKHQVVPDENTHQISPYEGLVYEEELQNFNQPLTAFAGEPGPADAAVEAMVSRLEIPFELGAESGRLLWAVHERREFDRLEGLADVAAWLRDSVEKIVREEMAEASRSPPVKEIRIEVMIWKRTVLDADLFGSLDLGDEVDDDEEVNADDGFAAEEFLETVMYDGDISSGDRSNNDEFVCAICMDEVLSGTYIARLPCSHGFHGDCVVPWLQRNKTCPLCRFKLVNKVD